MRSQRRELTQVPSPTPTMGVGFPPGGAMPPRGWAPHLTVTGNAICSDGCLLQWHACMLTKHVPSAPLTSPRRGRGCPQGSHGSHKVIYISSPQIHKQPSQDSLEAVKTTEQGI